jgi:hypothetical protein
MRFFVSLAFMIPKAEEIRGRYPQKKGMMIMIPLNNFRNSTREIVGSDNQNALPFDR